MQLIRLLQSKVNNKILAIVVNLLFIFLILILHLSFPSLLNSHNPGKSIWFPADTILQQTWQLHNIHPAFAGRAITGTLVEGIHQLTNWNFSYSFIVVNFTLLFFCGWLVYLLAVRITKKEKYGMVSLIVFYLSYNILFAFFRSIDTYDEPVQYLFIFLAFWFWLDKRWFLALGSLFGALLARETTIILFPAIAFFLLNDPIEKYFPEKKEYLKKITYLVICAGLAFFCIETILQHKQLINNNIYYLSNQRFVHWQFNFQNFQYSYESILSLFLILAIPMLVIWNYAKKHILEKMEKKILWSAILVFLINTPIVLLSTRAREARLFALPLVFLWPILGKYIWQMFQDIVQQVKMVEIRWYQVLVSFLLFVYCCILSYLLSFVFFQPTYNAGFKNGFEGYSFVYLLIISVLSIISLFCHLGIKNVQK